MIDRGDRLLEGASRKQSKKLMAFRCAVRDIVDALATNVGPRARTPLAAIIEYRIFQRRTRKGADYLQFDCWAEFDAPTRLMYVRFALLILGDPGGTTNNPNIALLRGNWYFLRHRRIKLANRQPTTPHELPTLMFLIALELPQEALEELNARAAAWPSDLRRRLAYATAATRDRHFYFPGLPPILIS
jgi:hypothetical protein